MLEQLKEDVWKANLQLPKDELVTFTWGNVRSIDREKGLCVIGPSGVSYEELEPEHMVVMDLEGNKVEGDLNPSTDTATHLELYKAFPEIGGVVHTHSTFAVGWAQAGCDIPLKGTTHADYFYGDIPRTRNLTPEEVEEGYEKNTGKVIIEAFEGRNPVYVPGVICRNKTAPFVWGKDCFQAWFITLRSLRKWRRWISSQS